MSNERHSRRGPQSESDASAGFAPRGKPGGQTLTGAFPAPPSDDVDARERLQRELADIRHREAKLIAAPQKQDLHQAQIIGESIGVLRTCLDLLAAHKSGVEEAEVQRLGSDGADALDRMATLAELATPATQPKAAAARAADADAKAPRPERPTRRPPWIATSRKRALRTRPSRSPPRSPTSSGLLAACAAPTKAGRSGPRTLRPSAMGSLSS